MTDFIQWCNTNNGFVSAILTCVTVLLSLIAIIISIRMAKLPFKKKLKLGGSIGFGFGTGITTPIITGYYVNACNVGNRAVNISFLGLALSQGKGKSGFDLLHNLQGTNKCDEPIKPTEVFEIEYPAENLVRSLLNQDQSRMVYLYVQDTEGGTKKKKIGTVNQFLSQFSD